MTSLSSPARRTLLKAGLGGVALALAGCIDRLPAELAGAGVHAFHGETMGTRYTVKLRAARASETALAAARSAVAAALAGVVDRMSIHDPASELSRFNGHRSTSPFALTADTIGVLAVADEVSAASRGAFDVTVAPAVAAWGFGPGGQRHVPPADEIAAARAEIGHRGLRVDPASGTATKAWAGVAADLSGVAKGFGSDRAAAALEALGFADYMVEVGGEVRARGRNADGLPWQIAIERPDAMPPRPYFVAPLADAAMATSGDYRIYFEQQGRRYSHEIDPGTAAPVTHRLASVSVVAVDCAHADAWSTALFVLGPDAGPALACDRGLAAYFIVREPGGGFRDVATPAFATLGGRLA